MNEMYNVNYERSFLGCLIMNNALADTINGRITADSFYDLTNRKIFTKVFDLCSKGNCNLLTLTKELSDIRPDVIASLTDDACGGNFDFYLQNLRNMAIARNLKSEIGRELSSINPDTVFETMHKIDSINNKCMRIDSFVAKDSNSMLTDMIKIVQKNANEHKIMMGYDTGFDNLSRITEGIITGQLYILSARASIGKTAFELQLTSNLCKTGVPVAIFSLEMSAASLIMRMTSQVSGVPIKNIRYGRFSPEQITRFYGACDAISKYRMHVYDESITDKELYTKIRTENKVHGTKVFFIDHLGLIRYSGLNPNKVIQLDEITQELKSMAKELDVAIIVLSQLSRKAEHKEPTLDDLRDSGAIEQNADVVMFIHRERANGTEESIETKVIVAKNRDGSCGTAWFQFFPRETKFVEQEFWNE